MIVTRYGHPTGLGLVCVLLIGCNQETTSTSTIDSPPHEGEGEGDGDGDGDGEPGEQGWSEDGDGDGEPGCAEDEIECGGVCVNPDTDAQNCGQCNRACFENAPWLDGGCWEGECKPTYSGCFTQAMGFLTCADICASFGEVCHDDEDLLKCFAGVARGWHEEDGIQACQLQVAGVGLGSVDDCEENLESHFEDYPYIRCCCSQTAQLP